MTHTETGKGAKPPERDFDTLFARISKSYPPKALQVILGWPEAAVLQEIWYAPHDYRRAEASNSKKKSVLPVISCDGFDWVQMSRNALARHIGVTKSTMFNSKGGIISKLKDMGVLVSRAWETVTWFRVDTERMQLLLAVTYTFYDCKNEEEWQSFVDRHRDLVQSFQYRQKDRVMAVFPNTGMPSAIKSFKSRTLVDLSEADTTMAKKMKAWLKTHEKTEQQSRRKRWTDGVPPWTDGVPVVDGWRTTKQDVKPSASKRTASTVLSTKESGHTSYVDNFACGSVVLGAGETSDSGGEKRLQAEVECAASYFFDRRSYSPEAIAKLTAALVMKWRKDFDDYYESPEAFLQAWADYAEQCVDVKRRAPAPEPKTVDDLRPHPCKRVWKAFVLAHEADSAISSDY